MSEAIIKLGEQLIEKLRVENSFLFFGGVALIISIYVNQELGIKISLLTLIFGGVFRFINYTIGNLLAIGNMESKSGLLKFLIASVTFGVIILVIYAILINKLIKIF